jgi:hypothetical protein
MKIITGLVVAMLMACSSAGAQDANPYSGTWRAALVNNKGEHREGTVLLGESDGKWDFERRVYKNPCVGIPAPIVIRSVTADELVFEVLRSKSLKGCKDNVATLKRIDGRTLKGELDDGRRLTLTRE